MIVVVMMPMLVRVRLLGVRPFQRPAVEEDAETGPRDAAARRLAPLEGAARAAAPGDGLGEQLERHAEIAEIEAGPEEHVARQAAGTVEVVTRSAHDVAEATM